VLSLGTHDVVDLTQPLGPGATVWPGGAPLTADCVSELGRDGVYSRRIAFDEHCGTHLDAPGHVLAGASLVSDLPPAVLVAPLRVLDVAADCGENGHFTVAPSHLRSHEEQHGPAPAGAVLIARTGWDRFLGTPRYLGDGPAFPGFAPATARALLERGVVGVGIDTAGVDPGSASEMPVHRITAAAGVYHLEGLVGLQQVPAAGACLFVGALPLEQGSGVPARVLALVPR
jgi:kynurenine formamidase